MAPFPRQGPRDPSMAGITGGPAEPTAQKPSYAPGRSGGLPWYRLDRRPGPAFLVLFALLFSVQTFFMTKAPEEWVRPHTRWELQSVAVALAEGRGFSDPYLIPTGPTAHLPPSPPPWRAWSIASWASR